MVVCLFILRCDDTLRCMPLLPLMRSALRHAATLFTLRVAADMIRHCCRYAAAFAAVFCRFRHAMMPRHFSRRRLMLR